MKSEEELTKMNEKWKKLLRFEKQEFTVWNMEEGDPDCGSSTSSCGSSTSSHGGNTSSHGGNTSSHGDSTSNRVVSTSNHNDCTSGHGDSTSNRVANTSNHGDNTSSHGDSTSNHVSSTSSHGTDSLSAEGFTSNYANATFGHGTNTSSHSATTPSHDNKTCTHVANTPSDDEDNSPFGKTIHNAVIKCNMPNLKMKQTWTCSESVFPYFVELTNAYRRHCFTHVYEHLEGSRLIVLMNKELAEYFNNELKSKKSKGVIRALHAIHSLSLNPLSMPKVITKALVHDNFLSSLFDAKCHYNCGSFCFLTKEILTDVLSELFRKTNTKEWFLSFLTMLKNLCLECFGGDCKKPPTVCFNAIAAYLVIGIEALPLKFYPSLKYYFSTMLETISRNKLSSHCLEKVWDELLLFYEHWVKYALSYQSLNCLDPSCSMIEFKNCEVPDLSIFKNIYIRNRMKHEYVHVEDGYVPCEYPSVPSFPKLPKTPPTLEDMQKSSLFWSFLESSEVITEDIIGIGYCEECKESHCSCVQDYLESEAWKKQKLLSESDMEIDEVVENVLLDVVVKNVSLDEAVENISLDEVVENVSLLHEVVENVSLDEVVENVPVDEVVEKVSLDEVVEKVSLLHEVVEKVSSDKQNKHFSISKPQLWFDPSDGTDEDMTPEEMSQCYEALIKCNKTCSYSFSDSQAKRIWENIKIPDLTNALTCTASTLRERKKGLSSHTLSDYIKDAVVIL